jgi:antirestriction protein
MELKFSFVVRNLETGEDSRWIELHELDEEQARDEWDAVVDPNFDWEIVDFECSFSVNYYEFQYASFEKLMEAYEILKNATEYDQDALIAEHVLLNEGGSVEDLEMIPDRFVIFAGSDDEDLAYAIIDEMGFDGVVNPDYYFDYESFGRDLRFDGFDTDMEEEDPEYAEMLQDMTDDELAEHYIEAFGDLKELGQRTIERYFDYDAYGRDLAFDYDYVEIDDIEGWVSNQ